VDFGPVSDRRGIDRIKREIIGVPVEFDTFEAVLKHASPQNPRPPDNVLRRRLTYQTRLLPNGKIGWRYNRSIREARRRGTVPPSGDLWPPSKKIICPTLIFRGTETDLLPAEVAKQMTELINNAQLEEVRHAGHMVFEDNPDEFLSAVLRWL